MSNNANKPTPGLPRLPPPAARITLKRGTLSGHQLKRYLAFAFDDCYPSGGFFDFISDHDSPEEAMAAALRPGLENAQVVDLQTGHISPVDL